MLILEHNALEVFLSAFMEQLRPSLNSKFAKRLGCGKNNFMNTC